MRVLQLASGMLRNRGHWTKGSCNIRLELNACLGAETRVRAYAGPAKLLPTSLPALSRARQRRTSPLLESFCESMPEPRRARPCGGVERLCAAAWLMG